MSPTQIILIAATALAAAGLWLMLPRGEHGGRRLGAALSLVSLGLFASRLPRLDFLSAEGLVFAALAGITVISAACAVTFRSPVYCAIWFAMTLLGTAGLFLFQGAQFLGVATIVVYAGAILVTFLFVLMLAQPQGHAYYDRVSWEALLSASVGAVMIGVLTMVVLDAFAPRHARDGAVAAGLVDPTTAEVRRNEEFVEGDLKSPGILTQHHMATLGGHLFSEYLVAIEVAGTMLLAALVGAVAIAIQSKPLPRATEGTHHG